MIDRRKFLTLTALAGVGASARPVLGNVAPQLLPTKASSIPLAQVRLLDSRFRQAVEVNHKFLLSLEADRLLHNFYTGAGLPPRGEVYGGWEGDTIAGHTLGHYLTALALTYAQLGDEECKRRADYIVAQLAKIQAKRGDGYVAGFTRKRPDKTIADGQEIFVEIMKGDIRSGGFDLNGAWSPLYTVHKLFAGLLDVHAICGNTQALDVAIKLGAYFETVFAALSDEQMQQMLNCEYGGLNESFAEMYARTKDARWLRVAERLYDRRVLDPLEQQRDNLANFHSNTQVPKLIGLARIHELTGKPEPAMAARFFWERVTGHHSYVIGGNSDREYFFEPDHIYEHITEQTCEHCNSYNMLKLTRHLFSWQPDGRLFDYYERTHFNHVLSQQHPKTGMFTYMTPLMSGTAREFSEPTDSFWCCVGSGMESHAKHGDSIFWEGDGTLLVNLYIPARAEWTARNASVVLNTKYPFEGKATLTFEKLKKAQRFSVALRVPAWAMTANVLVNGKPVTATRESGYAIVARKWKAGDTVEIALPLELRIEATAGDPDTIAILRGPLVMAADLGPREQEFDGLAPALVGTDLLGAFHAMNAVARYEVPQGVARPARLEFAPFYGQYDQRTAVYFKRFTESAWREQQTAFLAEQARQKDIAARSVDFMHLGEMQPERDHKLASDISYPVSYRGKNGRDARSGGFFEFDLKVKPGPLQLQAIYWGGERNREFTILIDGKPLAAQKLDNDHPGDFFDVLYPVPEDLVKSKQSVRVRFEPKSGHSAGPVFGVRLFTPAGATDDRK